MIVEDTVQGSHVRSFHQLTPCVSADTILNIIVASKDGKLPKGLAHAPPHRLILDSTPGWAVSCNAALARAAAFGGDVLFLDDDVELTEGCLDRVFSHYSHADLFGLDLHDMEGKRQVGARHVLTNEGALVDWVESGPAYVAHVSTSAIYIKEKALGLRFPIWKGLHYEDFHFCLNAWLQGFKVLAVPGLVRHAIVSGVGSTKRTDPLFWQRWMANKETFEYWARTKQVFEQGIVPIGAKGL